VSNFKIADIEEKLTLRGLTHPSFENTTFGAEPAHDGVTIDQCRILRIQTPNAKQILVRLSDATISTTDDWKMEITASEENQQDIKGFPSTFTISYQIFEGPHERNLTGLVNIVNGTFTSPEEVIQTAFYTIRMSSTMTAQSRVFIINFRFPPAPYRGNLHVA
jgi:hypothetical protein